MKTRALILALSLTAAVAPAGAAETEKASIEVRIDDLYLANATDRERLEVRLESAARRLCHSGRRGLAESAHRSACVSEVLAGTGPQAERAIARAQNGSRLALLIIGGAR